MTEPRVCRNKTCQRPLERRPGDTPSRFAARRYCGRQCLGNGGGGGRPVGSITGPTSRTAYRLEDLADLLDAGVPLPSIPGRLPRAWGEGPLTALALSRWLRRHERHDLANLFDRVDVKRAA